MRATLFAVLVFGLSIASLGLGQRVGDEWITTRGDDTPNLTYSAATVTTSGRIIAVGSNGSLMYSDDGGANWEFDQIEVDGLPVFGGFSTIYQEPGGPLIAVMVVLEESSVGHFDFYTRTYFLTSSDNGNSWSQTPFPHSYATFQLTGRKYYGVNIAGLYLSPGGELIAYGTTTGTDHPGAISWNIGGAIFRRAGGTWVQAHFANGPVGKVADGAGGRSIAVAHNAVLDSADGSGWSGYVMNAAQVDLGGDPMDPETKYRLRVVDVETIGNDYVAQGGTFVPFDEEGLIDTNIFDEVYTLTSQAPFSGARAWQAYSQTKYFGTFKKAGGAILASGPGGVYRASAADGSFALTGADVRAWAETIAVSGSTATAVQSSETVWQSANAGSSWTKVWNKSAGPDLRLLGTFGGVIYAVHGGFGGGLWISRDNGKSWQEGPASFEGTPVKLVEGADGRVISPAPGNAVQVSDDGGATWTKRSLPATQVSAALLARTKTGRLIVPASGNIVTNVGEFYVSDDNGETWSKRVGTHKSQQTTMKDIAVAKSGRIIFATNSGSVFDPTLHFSDDDGDTWTSSDVLRTLEGLNEVSNDPSQRYIDIKRVRVGSSGRIVALGDDEILTSDDEGETWRVRVNLTDPPIIPNPKHSISDVIQVGSRWVAIGHWEVPFPDSRIKKFLMISDDDGATWGERPFPTNINNTFLSNLLVGADGRLIIAGGNSAVFVSDPPAPPPPGAEPIGIREGATTAVPIERPDLDGAIEARYAVVGVTAVAGVDFVASVGLLTWAADDMSDKSVLIETIDNAVFNPERSLALQVVFETADGLLGQIENPVYIEDEDGAARGGIAFEGISDLYTTEAGGSATLRFALEKKPTSNVVVSIEGLDATEGSLSASQFTFTPANWSALQSLTIAGIDDTFPDGDASYQLSFAIQSSDSNYSVLPDLKVLVTNIGNEAYQVGGELLDSSELAGYSGYPIAVAAGGLVTFQLPDTLDGIAVGSELSMDLEVWTPGPDPVAGASAGGFTTYTLQLPEADPAVFARITFSME